MLSVSNYFKDQMVSPLRQVVGKVTFAQEDVDAKTDATPTATSEAEVSSLAQTIDSITDSSVNYASFETDRWKLDGSFKLIPDSGPYGEVGWWSDVLSASDGTFTPNQTLTFNFSTTHSSIGLTIAFDSAQGEYASEYTVKAYDSGNTLINTFDITNTDVISIIDTPMLNYQKIEIIIKKWSLPYRRARVLEVVFGILKVFEGNSLIDMQVIEELDPISSKVTSNELSFKIENTNNQYDIINPGGIYQYLQKQQVITAYLGATSEYARLGTFYLTEWKTESNGIVASFKARDRFEFLQDKYRKGLLGSITLYDLAVSVFTEAGLTVDQYNVDTALQSVTVNSFLGSLPYRQTLQQIAIAGKCVLYSDRDGILQLKRLSNTVQDFTLDLDNAYNYPSVELDKPLKSVTVNIYNFVAEVATSEVFNGTATITGTQDVWVEYGNPANSAAATVTGGTLNSATYYTNAAKLNITASGAVTIKVNGYKINKYTTELEVNNVGVDEGQTLKIDNQLITTNSLALDVANWVISETGKRHIYKSNWRQNPMVESGDLILVENQFTDPQEIRITKQTFNFNGALKGDSEGRSG